MVGRSVRLWAYLISCGIHSGPGDNVWTICRYAVYQSQIFYWYGVPYEDSEVYRPGAIWSSPDTGLLTSVWQAVVVIPRWPGRQRTIKNMPTSSPSDLAWRSS